jgi:hypothetical protein
MASKGQHPFYILMRVIFFIFTMAISSVGFAQGQKKSHNLYGVFQFGYLKGTGNIEFNDVRTANKGNAFRARISGGYYITPKFSTGLGWGLEGYHDPDYNLAPLFVESRYFLKPMGNALFIQANAGYQLSLSNEFRKGTYLGIYGGYKIGKKRVHVLLSTGLDFNQVRNANILVYDATTNSLAVQHADIWLKSISFNCAFEF